MPANFGRAFAVGITLNTVFVAIEAAYGFVSNSTALLADAGHNLSDVLGLLVAWGAFALARQPPSQRFTYGLRGGTILAALFNAMFLLVAVGAIAWEAVLRLRTPEPIEGVTVMIVAGIGIAINAATALFFASGRKSDINIEGAFLHMAADAAVSAGVVLAALVYLFTGWNWIDAVASLAICAVILWGTWGLLNESIRLSLSGVPRGIEVGSIRDYLLSRDGVASVHDLHIWPISSTDVALTCHLVLPDGHPGDAFLMDLAHDIEHEFKISHVTIQIETREGAACSLAPDNIV